MNNLKRFSIILDNRYFRQQLPGVITHGVVGHSRLVLSPHGHTDQDGHGCTLGIQVKPGSPPGAWNQSPLDTSQFVVDASFLMDKRLVDEAAWTQNRAITPQEVPDYGDLRQHIPANDSGRWMCGICAKPTMPERAPWTNA
ncbi:hypothetical protein [Pseudomonas sp. B28(2017)]|uniref:hypothetical protein n=1 Tax=Pseudomonas sp. B28(2017) TaxID=1981730 RepID=UPI000A1F3A70|nr:hypothetical protein [Pseudomonas sp. B28(2017)]